MGQQQLHERRGVKFPGVTGLAMCFAGGIAASRWGEDWGVVLFPGWLIGGAGALLIVAWVLRGMRGMEPRRFLPGHPALGLVWGSVFLFGMAWMGVRSFYLAGDDLAGMLGETKELVKLRGVVEGTPRVRGQPGGSMAAFERWSPASYFPMRVEGLVGREGEVVEVSGRVSVKVEGVGIQVGVGVRAGVRVEVQGFLLPARGPANPGSFDSARYARMRGRAGLVVVPHVDLVRVIEGELPGVGMRWVRWREQLRQRASGWLQEEEPTGRQERERAALLEALLLGTRSPGLDDLMVTFQHLGLAHLLAISGMHLGIMAGMVLLVARRRGGYGRWQGWLVMGVVLGYLFMVETRMPVLRAGVMTLCASLGLASGRRLDIRGLLALSAIGLLLWRPDDLFSAGFQLSYGVVLGLIHLTGPAKRAWFGIPGPSELTPVSIWAMLREWGKTGLTATLVAWLVATPLVLFHFGLLAPLGIPLTILALPLVTVILGLGFAKMLTAAILGWSVVPDWMLNGSADLMIGIVRVGEALPGSFVPVPFPGAWWLGAAVGWVWWWLGMEDKRKRRRVRWLGLPVVGWVVWPMVFAGPGAGVALRIDMLSVGNGSCYVMRSGDSAVVFDAGSSSVRDAGRRLIVPALHHLGVRRVEAVVISHPNLDHYSAVLEIADYFGVGEVLVTESFLEQARIGYGPVAWLKRELEKRGVPVRDMVAGDGRKFGEAQWTWLHPAAGVEFKQVNNTSAVIRIEAAGRRVLMTGDVQKEGMARLEESGIDLYAEVLELPHHGSFHEAAVELVERVRPLVVMQSTGQRRWAGDRWGDILENQDRLVTARDGACAIIIRQDGEIRSERFRNSDPGGRFR